MQRRSLDSGTRYLQLQEYIFSQKRLTMVVATSLCIDMSADLVHDL